MRIDRSTATASAVAAAPADLSSSERHGIFLYLGILIILLAFGGPAGGLIDIPISFFLKNRLHLTAHEVAIFRLVAAIPLYLSFVFGFVRDIWNPLGMRDRGFMLLFGGVTALLYILFAFTPMSYATLDFGVVVLTVSFLFVSSAQNGLTSVIGQQHAMTGQVSAVWNVFLSIPTVGALLIGGKLSGLLEEKEPDQARPHPVSGRCRDHGGDRALCAVEAGGGVRQYPRRKRDGPSSDGGYQAAGGSLAGLSGNADLAVVEFRAGLDHAAAISPPEHPACHRCPMGQWNAIFAASFIPTFIVFGFLCRKFPLKTLLVWGTLLAVPQMVPLLFIDTVTQALIAAIPIGLMGGVATGAYLDLIIRSCPRGLQGTTLMMSCSLYYVVSRFGDVLGTHLYDRYGGFTVCVVAITIVYALILPALLLVPKHLIATADGQTPDIRSAPRTRKPSGRIAIDRFRSFGCRIVRDYM